MVAPTGFERPVGAVQPISAGLNGVVSSRNCIVISSDRMPPSAKARAMVRQRTQKTRTSQSPTAGSTALYTPAAPWGWRLALLSKPNKMSTKPQNLSASALTKSSLIS